jgi:threonine dehydratase
MVVTSLEAVRDAQQRIASLVRRTPVLNLDRNAVPGLDNPVSLKLESLQVTGSFKFRGALNRLRTIDPAQLAGGLVAASGGNHGLANAFVARLAGIKATIYLPSNAAPIKAEKLRRLGAEVRFAGSVWDEAHEAASAEAERSGAFYVHPFCDEAVVTGHATVALELVEQLPDADCFIIAVGGGGLISGLASVVKALRPGARVIGVEPVGSPTLKASLDAGHVVRLPKVTTRVATMACGRTDERIFEAVRDQVDDIVLITDEDMQAAAEVLWFDYGLAADLSGAASLAALLSGAVRPAKGERIAGLVCGAGTDGILPS